VSKMGQYYYSNVTERKYEESSVRHRNEPSARHDLDGGRLLSDYRAGDSVLQSGRTVQQAVRGGRSDRPQFDWVRFGGAA